MTNQSDYVSTLHTLAACCKAWVPEARILGNVRADDAANAIAAAIAALQHPSAQDALDDLFALIPDRSPQYHSVAKRWMQAGHELCCLTECVDIDDANPRKSLDAVISYFQELDRDPTINAIRDADTRRLDWLASSPRLSEIHVDGKVVDCYFYGVAGAPGVALRDIIDVAMAAQGSAPR